ncbi:T9SS type A sorting domain-containing protein, partial [bacterium]|nr:T9SS type A sorting domain-containing protein [bacterium]
MFLCNLSIYAQDSTFTITEAFRFYPPYGTSSGLITTCDLNRNGIEEIVAVFNYRDYGHRLHIFRNGESIHVTESEPGWACIGIFTCDFNRDGQQDVIFEIQNDHVLEAYYGPEYELNLAEAFYYYGWIKGCTDRILENGDKIPIVIIAAIVTNSYMDGDSSSWESWSYGQVWQDTWLRGRPERVATVCFPISFILWDNGQTGSDLFVAGNDDHLLEVAGGGNYYTSYFQLFTTYGRDFSEPDSLVIFEGPSFDENDREIGWTFGLSRKSAVGDFDDDGELDWAQPFWQETRQDTFAVHLPVYNPVDLSLNGEYVEEVSNIFVDEMFGPDPALGVAAIDINNDDVWELLLAIQDRPLRVIDPSTMEVIMSSDFVLPDILSYIFYVGRFDESGRLQILIVDNESYVVYNLPEEWNAPNTVPTQEEKLPHQFNILSTYPNPFNSTTSISYSLDRDAFITLKLYDIKGREVAGLVNERQSAGNYQTIWNAEAMSSGVYLLRLEAEGEVS